MVRAEIYMIGDSTMSDRAVEAAPATGWGQALSSLLAGRVTVHNHAASGRSTKSFIDEGRWASVRAALQPGDVLIIQFGHNDQKTDSPERYAEAWTDYTDNLHRFVREGRQAGATPILATSICRRCFTDTGQLQRTLADYPAATRALAAELGVAMVDLNLLTASALAALGPEASRDWFLHLPAGRHSGHPEGKSDNTHLSAFGAETVARLFMAGLRTQQTDLSWVEPTPPMPGPCVRSGPGTCRGEP
jgi:lysophospholipase L1-like esterase